MEAAEATFANNELETYDRLFAQHALVEAGTSYVPNKAVVDLLNQAKLTKEHKGLLKQALLMFQPGAACGPGKARFRLILKTAAAVLIYGPALPDRWWKKGVPLLKIGPTLEHSSSAGGIQNSYPHQGVAGMSGLYPATTSGVETPFAANVATGAHNYQTLQPARSMPTANPFDNQPNDFAQRHTEQPQMASGGQTKPIRTPLEILQTQLHMVSKAQSVDLPELSLLVQGLEGAVIDRIPLAALNPSIRQIKAVLGSSYTSKDFIKNTVLKYDRSKQQMLTMNDAFCCFQELLCPTQTVTNIQYFLTAKPAAKPDPAPLSPLQNLMHPKIAAMEARLADMKQTCISFLGVMQSQYDFLAQNESEIGKDVTKLAAECDAAAVRAHSLCNQSSKRGQQIAAVRDQAQKCLQSLQELTSKAEIAVQSLQSQPQLYQEISGAHSQVQRITLQTTELHSARPATNGKHTGPSLDETMQLNSYLDTIEQGTGFSPDIDNQSDSDDPFEPQNANVAKAATSQPAQDDDEDMFSDATPSPALKVEQTRSTQQDNVSLLSMAKASGKSKAVDAVTNSNVDTRLSTSKLQDQSGLSKVESTSSAFEKASTRDNHGKKSPQRQTTAKTDSVANKSLDSADRIDMPKRTPVDFWGQGDSNCEVANDGQDDFF